MTNLELIIDKQLLFFFKNCPAGKIEKPRGQFLHPQTNMQFSPFLFSAPRSLGVHCALVLCKHRRRGDGPYVCGTTCGKGITSGGPMAAGASGHMILVRPAVKEWRLEGRWPQGRRAIWF